MAIHLRTSLLGAAAGFLLLGMPAQAQEPMSEAEIAGYFDRMSQEVNEMVEAGDFSDILDWVEQEIADEATFFASVEGYGGDERKSFNVFVLDKQDMSDMGRIAVGAMTGLQGASAADMIEEYSLEIEVSEVHPAGPDAATVSARFIERVTLAMPQGQTAGAAEESDDGQEAEANGSTGAGEGEAQSITIEATADCEHFIRRAQAGGALQMGLSACQATVRF